MLKATSRVPPGWEMAATSRNSTGMRRGEQMILVCSQLISASHGGAPRRLARRAALGIAVTATLAVGGAVAAPGDGVTIGDVAAMEPNQKAGYIMTEAGRRVAEIGAAEGNAARDCLKQEFLGVKLNPDQTVFVPRGLTAAIRLIHTANDNGNAAEPAAQTIVGMVDLVAQRVCGVPARTGLTR